MPVLTVDGLTKVFGDDEPLALEMLDAGRSKDEILAETGCTVAVRDASFSVEEGETFVVMGRSGSGKSTLLRCLNGLVTPTRGTVHVEGEELTAMSQERLREVCRTRLSMVFQQFGLFPHRTVAGNVAFGPEVSGADDEDIRQRVNEALAQVGLDSYAQQHPDELSGGMQQRVGLARALATDPDILLMDEPFSALDPLIRTELQDEVMRLQETRRRTLVFITHDVDEAFRIADRLAIMDGGEIVQTGVPVHVLANPATPYVRDFVADVDRMRALSAGDVVKREHGDDDGSRDRSGDLPTLDAAAPLGEVAAHVLRDGPHRVVNNGTPAGIITPETVATLLHNDADAA